jgi:hypothetical protein
MLLVLHKSLNGALVGINSDQLVSIVEEIHDGKHVATEVYTTNPYVHYRVTERLTQIKTQLTAPVMER